MEVLEGETLEVPARLWGEPYARSQDRLRDEDHESVGWEKLMIRGTTNKDPISGSGRNQKVSITWVHLCPQGREEYVEMALEMKYFKQYRTVVAKPRAAAAAKKAQPKAKAPASDEPKVPKTPKTKKAAGRPGDRQEDAAETSSNSEDEDRDLGRARKPRAAAESNSLREIKPRKKRAAQVPDPQEDDSSEEENEELKVPRAGDSSEGHDLAGSTSEDDSEESGGDEGAQDGDNADDSSQYDSEDFEDDNEEDLEHPAFTADWNINGPAPRLIIRSNTAFMDTFCYFIGDIGDDIIKFTNANAASKIAAARRASGGKKARAWVTLNKGLLYRYIAICMLMGVFRRSCKEDYFRSYNVAGVIFPNLADYGMGLTQFEQITRYLTFADYTKPGGENDKFWKFGDIIALFNDKAKKSWYLGKHIDVDEAMVPFKGKAPCKQYIPSKPRKRGLKAWCLNDSSNGFFYAIAIYRGKYEAVDRPPQFSVGEYAVIALIRDVGKEYFGNGTVLYTDRFFTSIKLFAYLRECKILAVGTCNVQKTGPKAKQMTKKKGGFPRKYNMPNSTTTAKGERKYGVYKNWLAALTLQDTKVVSYLSTAYGLKNGGKRIVRRNKANGRHTKYSACDIPKFYNKFMGGTDLGDKYRAGRFAILFFCRKWTVVLFFNLVQIILTNVFLIFKSSRPTLDHTQFTLELAEQLLKSSNTLLRKTATPVVADRSKADNEGRYTRPHFPSRIGTTENGDGKMLSIQRDCMHCKDMGVYAKPKSSNTKGEKRPIRSIYECKQCTKSGKYVCLCAECFQGWHTQ